MKVETVTCDQCARDLTEANLGMEYRLALAVQSKTFTGDVISLAAVAKPLDFIHHFCNFRCLSDWLANAGYFAVKDKE